MRLVATVQPRFAWERRVAADLIGPLLHGADVVGLVVGAGPIAALVCLVCLTQFRSRRAGGLAPA